MLRVAVALCLLLACWSPHALSADAPPAAADDTAGTATRTVGDNPWYSLFLDNRSDKFAALRLQRTELMRKLTQLESEVKDLREKNAVLDDQLKRMQDSRVAVAEAISDVNATIQDLESQKDHKKLEVAQRKEVMKLDGDKKRAEIERLRKALPATAENEAAARQLEEEIAQDTLYLSQYEQSIGLDIADFDRQIDDLKSRDAERQSRRKDIEDQRKAALLEAQSALRSNTEAIEAKRVEIAALYDKIDTIDAQVLKLIDVGDTDGWFKIIISLFFALLVAGVIYGFYRVIGQRPQIIDEIFSNDSGIQFVTIFSIVIAVILFGIIGVLEGRELSALLGGLSGYILGRNAATPKPPRAEPKATGSGKENTTETGAVAAH